MNVNASFKALVCQKTIPPPVNVAIILQLNVFTMLLDWESMDPSREPSIFDFLD